MEKQKIETFIKKYSLNGLIDQCRWVVKDKTVRVTSMTSDKKFLTNVIMKDFAVDDVEIGIIDSAKFKQLLGVVGETTTLEVNRDDNNMDTVRSLTISDDKSEVYLMAADLDVLPPEPKLKTIPSFDVEIKLTEDFVEKFNKSLSATGAELFTLVMNKKKQKLELVFGYGRNNSNRISLPVECSPDKDTVKNPISFSAKNLKEVLSANSENDDPILKISEAGLAVVEYDNKDFQSQYYMIKIEIED